MTTLMMPWSLVLMVAASSQGGGLSASALFESTVLSYHVEAQECHRPGRSLSERGQRRLAGAIASACDRVWPGDAERPEWMFALKLTETYVGPSNKQPVKERTYGPWCMTVFEAREAARVLGIALPRSAAGVIEVLEDDYPTSALLAARTVMSYEHMAGDRVRGLLTYKYGPHGLARALLMQPGPPTDLWPWGRFASKLAEVRCVRERLLAQAPCTCGCLP